MRKHTVATLMLLIPLTGCYKQRPVEGEYRIDFEGASVSSGYPVFDRYEMHLRPLEDSIEFTHGTGRWLLGRVNGKVRGSLHLSNPDLAWIDKQTPYIMEGRIYGEEIRGHYKTSIKSNWPVPNSSEAFFAGKFCIYPAPE